MNKLPHDYDDPTVTKKINDAYFAVPQDTREDIIAASLWARDTLTQREGAGHIFNVVAQDSVVVCSFAKPQWPGDHCSRPMESGSEAIVLAVCEYIVYDDTFVR